MTLFWIANLIVWGLVMGVTLKGAVAAALRIKGSVRRGDPMMLGTFLVAFFVWSQLARWLIAPDNQNAWKAIYVIGFFTALYVLRLTIAYGRGEHV